MRRKTAAVTNAASFDGSHAYSTSLRVYGLDGVGVAADVLDDDDDDDDEDDEDDEEGGDDEAAAPALVLANVSEIQRSVLANTVHALKVGNDEEDEEEEEGGSADESYMVNHRPPEFFGCVDFVANAAVPDDEVKEEDEAENPAV